MSQSDVKMTLIFHGYSQHEDINDALQLTSDGNAHYIWEFSQVPFDAHELDYGEFEDWQEFLQSKKDGLVKLYELGYRGKLQIQFVVPENSDGHFAERFRDYFIVEPSFLALLAEANLKLEVLYGKVIPHTVLDEELRPHALSIDCPMFYSDSDESNFFNWLNHISAISSVKGRGTSLSLFLNQPFLDDVSLRSLIGLMFRYELDMTCLKEQLTEENAHWFKAPKAFFHKRIFGDGKIRKRSANKRGASFNVYPS